MNPHPVGGAIWDIETHLGSELSLAEIANFVKVSRFNLLRAFGAATGLSIMSYVRPRRLTEAARQLASGAADILGVATGAGSASHETFTRAFREQFGQTPDAVRAQGHTSNIKLVEAFGMSENVVSLEQPRFEDGRVIW